MRLIACFYSLLLAAAAAVMLAPAEVRAQQAPVRRQPIVERPIAFDSAGRLTVMTPTMAARLKLVAPLWPLANDWTEARLYSSDSTSAVLVAQRVDGSVARYGVSQPEVVQLRGAISMALLAQIAIRGRDSTREGTGLEQSEPAGNAFVRNQVLLGLIAYGPATSAILSDNGAAAAGGYFVAAGASFFLAAELVRSRSVTRAQNNLASYGGTRGAAVGAAIAAIATADGGAGFGVPILAGAVGGTVLGFQRARSMSDGEASASGFVGDLSALTTLGVGGTLGAFEDDATSRRGIAPRHKVALGTSIASGLVGHYFGPRYARRSAYNVTAGDVDMAYSSALLGGIFANAFIGDGMSDRTAIAASTAGMLGGAVAGDRLFVRRRDRRAADGTLAQLGAAAGMLVGGGLSLMFESGRQASVGMIAAGGFAGLALADGVVQSSPDAGPRGGVMRSRVSMSIVPAATAIAFGLRDGRGTRVALSERPVYRNVPVLRIAF